MAYEKLFEPGRIGGLTIRNRAVMSPMGTDLADIRGNATPRLIAYYTERAKGGIGLIINEYTGVDDVDSIPTQHNLRMAQDYNVQEAEELTRSVHAYGAKIFAQLHHGGATSKSAFTGRQNLSPSGVPMAPGGEVPREMTLEDIKRVQEKFIAAAVRCKKAGYDGVELHGAHSYLIAQFFSKYYNRRTDAYGGSLENRCRFIDEIIAGIRAKLGRYPISVRICGDEMTDEPGFLTLADGLEIGRHLEAQGIDCINISNGSSWNGNANCEPFSYTPGWKKHVAKAFKEALSHPRHRHQHHQGPGLRRVAAGGGRQRLRGPGPQPVRGPGVHEQGQGRQAGDHPQVHRLHVLPGAAAGQRHAGGVLPEPPAGPGVPLPLAGSPEERRRPPRGGRGRRPRRPGVRHHPGQAGLCRDAAGEGSPPWAAP